VLATRSYNSFLENGMVQFNLLDYLIFLTQSPSVLLVADVAVTAVSYIVASMAKTLSRS
jgi:hypothetical protein